jgi:nicotinate-nucleotide--dimethylbenzimidazole phosphoribosyltransferase
MRKRRGEVTDSLVMSHRSAEPGHDVILNELGLEPLLDLKLRLGEGTGALLALPIIQSSVDVISFMADMSQCGISARNP